MKPLRSYVIVKPIEVSDTTDCGIVLPDEAKERVQECDVIAVSDKWINDYGQELEPLVKVGQRVFIKKYTSTAELPDGNWIINEADILAIL